MTRSLRLLHSRAKPLVELAPDSVLTHQLISKPGASPERWMLALHGVFGMGQNFRSIARSLTEMRPEWGVVLVDLRAHGTSQGFSPPHDLAATVGDLDRLIAAIDLPVRAILGHSFGGKVALAWLGAHPGTMHAGFILDSMPGARIAAPENDVVSGVLETLEAMQQPFSSREGFKAILRARGYEASLVEWLAMNVRRAGDSYELRLDLPAIRALLGDYWGTDLWHVVDDPRSAEHLVFVLGGRSHVFGDAERARLTRAQAQNPRLAVHVLPNAAHWVQAEDPNGVLQAIDSGLS